jgi:ADP-ribose pyrophosphatase
MATKPERLSRTVIYESAWVNLYVDKVRFPAGRVIDRHHILDFPRDGVAVLVENGESELLFVQAYRYTTGSLEWEVPAGSREPGEAIVTTAAREVREETGYETCEHELLYSFHPINGISGKTFHVVRCKAASDTPAAFDKNEIAQRRWFTLEQVRQMIGERQINSGFTLTALLLHLHA